MLQLIRQIFKDPEDKTDISLLFANQVGLLFLEKLQEECPGYSDSST